LFAVYLIQIGWSLAADLEVWAGWEMASQITLLKGLSNRLPPPFDCEIYFP